MKISYDLIESDKSGKHKFFARLRRLLAARGFQEVAAGDRSDIHLYVDKPSSKARFNIHRLDGVWLNTKMKDWRSRNQKIRDKVKQSDGVIYQNEFCAIAAKVFLSYSHPNAAVIINGADPNEFLIEPVRRRRPYILGVCKWRPHKRLKLITQAFLRADLDADLVILGEPDYKIDHPSVIYAGWQDLVSTNRWLVGCVATAHLCWLDWCPNSVVESLVAGKQVIHSTSGGTPLIVLNRGYAVQDKPWDFKPCDLYNPPELDVDAAAAMFRSAIENPKKGFDASDLHIERVADQYEIFFRNTARGVK